jgi:uncharacterized protein YkwD
MRSTIGALVSAAMAFTLAGIGAGRALAGPATATATCPGADLVPEPTDGPAIDAATVCLIDQVRASYHLRPLQSNHYLQRVATAQVATMLRWNYFSDNRPTGQTPLLLIARTRYSAHAARISAAQNLGWATRPYTTPLSMVTAWMKSPPHRKIILTGAFRDVGVGIEDSLPSVLQQGPAGAIYAVEFGDRVTSQAPRARPRR